MGKKKVEKGHVKEALEFRGRQKASCKLLQTVFEKNLKNLL